MTYLFTMDETSSILRQKQSDRRTGYFILSGIFFIGMAIFLWGAVHYKNPPKIRVVSFNQVGNLKIDDPVYLFGVPIGAVKSIELSERNVLVFFTVNRPVSFRPGYHIDNIEIGFMGDRILSIDFGDMSSPIIPEHDTLAGTFHPGVSEEVGMTWKLKGAIDSFIAISASLVQSGPLRASFARRINGIASAADSMSFLMTAMIANIAGGLPARLDSLNRLIDGVARFSRLADSLTRQQVSGLGEQIGFIGGDLVKLESTIDALIAVADKFESPKGADDHNAIAAFLAKMKVLRLTAIHVKEGLSQLGKLAIR